MTIEVPITPLDTRVLVKVPKLERKTAGGIILSDERVERDEMAQTTVELIAMGEFAFPSLTVRPEVGDHVAISKYAGLIYKQDGVEYRIIDTADGSAGVLGIIASPVVGEDGKVTGVKR